MECFICFNDIDFTKPNFHLKCCNNYLHNECIQNWLNHIIYNNTLNINNNILCPYCRSTNNEIKNNIIKFISDISNINNNINNDIIIINNYSNISNYNRFIRFKICITYTIFTIIIFCIIFLVSES